MNDLLALATIRRLLLELGYQLVREPARTPAGSLELWMHFPRDDLGGRSPFRVLQGEDGEAMVRSCLASFIESNSVIAQKSGGTSEGAI